MTRLTPKAEELVQSGREVLRPSEADRARVFQALLPRLGDCLGADGLNAPSTAPAAASGIAVKVGAAIVVISFAGAALFLALNTKSPLANPVATGPVPSAAAPRLAIEKVPESAPSAASKAQFPEERAPAKPHHADSLAKEVAILSQASAALHAGRPAAALKALDEHRRKFPRGALAQERTSARIQALCALGRTKVAQAELLRLVRTSPNSPHVARARKACGAVKD